MRNLTIVLLFCLLTTVSYAQKANELPNVNELKAAPSRLNFSGSPKVPVTTLSYCSIDPATNIGMDSEKEFGAFVSFPSGTMTAYSGNIINKVSIGLTQLDNIASIEIRIFEDTTGCVEDTATPAAFQTINVATLVNGWNDIELTTPYTISGSEIFVGFWIHQTAGYPIFVSDNTVADPEGGWIVDSTGWNTLSNIPLFYNWQIIAYVDDGVTPLKDVGITSVHAPAGCNLTGSELCYATVENLGSSDITDEFNILFELNGAVPVSVPVPVPIASGESIDVNFSIDMATPGSYDLVVYTSLTGDEFNANDTLVTTTSNIDPYNAPYSSDFESPEAVYGWAVENINNDSYFWNFYSDYGVEGSNAAGYHYSATTNADDFLFSPCLDLTTGVYNVTFEYAAFDEGYPESLEVFWGTGQNAAAMTNSIVNLPEIVNTNYQTSTTSITIPADGTYYIGFKCYSPADMYLLFVDNFSISTASDISSVADKKISIYPNPAKDYLIIENAESIVVYNMIGEVVASVDKANTLTTIDISTLGNGSYIVKVNAGTDVITKKINLFR